MAKMFIDLMNVENAKENNVNYSWTVGDIAAAVAVSFDDKEEIEYHDPSWLCCKEAQDMPDDALVMPLDSLFSGLFNDSSPALLVSNRELAHGAGMICLTQVMEKVKAYPGFEKGFYVLPSSIHEVIYLPMNDMYDVKDLREMVQEINHTQVAPDERLSDKVYKVTESNHLEVA